MWPKDGGKGETKKNLLLVGDVTSIRKGNQMVCVKWGGEKKTPISLSSHLGHLGKCPEKLRADESLQ